MRRSAVVTAVVVALAATASANPIPTLITPSGIAHSDGEVFLLGAAAALLEWVVVRDGLRGRVRSERGLATVVAAAHVVSYPATVRTADRIFYELVDWRFHHDLGLPDGPTSTRYLWWAHTAELVAVGVEFSVYVVAFRHWRRSPVAPAPSVGRLLGLTVFANAFTWSLGLVWTGYRHGLL